MTPQQAAAKDIKSDDDYHHHFISKRQERDLLEFLNQQDDVKDYNYLSPQMFTPKTQLAW
jgi:hypothetical protein